MKKENVKNGLAGIGVAAIAATVVGFAANAIYNNIEYELENTSFNFDSILQGRIGADLQIKIRNGNAVGATITHVIGQVFYGDLKLTDVNAPLPIRIPPNGIGTGTIRLSVAAATLTNDIINAFSGAGNVYNTLVNRLRFKGTIYTNIVNVPVNMTIPITVG